MIPLLPACSGVYYRKAECGLNTSVSILMCNSVLYSSLTKENKKEKSPVPGKLKGKARAPPRKPRGQPQGNWSGAGEEENGFLMNILLTPFVSDPKGGGELHSSGALEDVVQQLGVHSLPQQSSPALSDQGFDHCSDRGGSPLHQEVQRPVPQGPDLGWQEALGEAAQIHQDVTLLQRSGFSWSLRIP